MDRWKILAFTFGGLWALTLVGLAVVMSTAPGDARPDGDGDGVASRSGSVVEVTERSDRMPFEARGTESGGDAGRMAAAPSDGTVPAWVDDESAPLPDDIMARARKQFRAERDDQREERRDEMADEIEAFIDDEGLSAADAAKLRDTLDGFRDRMDTMRDAMRSGDADFREVRSSMREARDALSTELDTQLGSDGADRLRERMFGGNAGFGPRRPAAPPL